jgi:hypothetical protein
MYSKSSNNPSFAPINNERSTMNTYGDGNVYTGPVSNQQYENQSKYIYEISKQAIPHSDGLNSGSLSSPSTNNPSLSPSPSTEIVSNSNQHQFKVMLLGDSGVGKFRLFVYRFNY